MSDDIINFYKNAVEVEEPVKEEIVPEVVTEEVKPEPIEVSEDDPLQAVFQTLVENLQKTKASEFNKPKEETVVESDDPFQKFLGNVANIIKQDDKIQTDEQIKEATIGFINKIRDEDLKPVEVKKRRTSYAPAKLLKNYPKKKLNKPSVVVVEPKEEVKEEPVVEETEEPTVRNSYVKELKTRDDKTRKVHTPGKPTDLKTLVEKKVREEIDKFSQHFAQISMTAGGGGSVAVQYANGGTMNGNLNVTGKYLSGGVDIATLFGQGGGTPTNSLSANGYTLTLNNDGSVTFPDNIIRSEYDAPITLISESNNDAYYTGIALSPYAFYAYDNAGNNIYFNSTDNNIVLETVSAYPWTFGSDGVFTGPNNVFTVGGTISALGPILSGGVDIATLFGQGGTTISAAITGNWQSTYQTVCALSADWNTAYNITTAYSSISGTFATNSTVNAVSSLLTLTSTTNTLTGLLTPLTTTNTLTGLLTPLTTTNTLTGLLTPLTTTNTLSSLLTLTSTTNTLTGLLTPLTTTNTLTSLLLPTSVYQNASGSFITAVNGTANQINASKSGSVVTLSLPNSAVFPGDLSVIGNLTVAGTASYINTQNFVVGDNLIYFNNNNYGSNVLDIGLVAHFSQAPLGYNHTGLVRRAGQGVPGVWTLFSGLTTEPLSAANLDWNDPNIRIDSLSANLLGNASTVTNGVYTNGSYPDPSWITSLADTKITGTAFAKLSSQVYSPGTNTGAITTIIGYNTASGYYSNIAGGCNNISCNYYASVVGGTLNVASGNASFVGGGQVNCATSDASVVAGGRDNTASGSYSTISGGYHNVSSGYHSSIGGGCCNTAFEVYTTVAGGCNNTASGYCSSVGGGGSNMASGPSTNVAGGQYNTASADFSNVAGGCYNTATNLFSNIAGGGSNSAYSYYSNVAGGLRNTVSAEYSNVSGGIDNFTSGYASSVAGGICNFIGTDSGYHTASCASAILGGCCNYICAVGVGLGTNDYSSVCYVSIGGGSNNLISVNVPSGNGVVDTAYSSIVGGRNNIITNLTDTFIIGSNITAGQSNYTYVNNISSLGLVAVANGNSDQWNSVYTYVNTNSATNNPNYNASTFAKLSSQPYTVTSSISSIQPVLGSNNTATGTYSLIGNGTCNIASGYYSTIVNSFSSCSTAPFTFVGSGSANRSTNTFSAIVGGLNNTASGCYSFIGGGRCNFITSYYTSVGVGINLDSTIAGGRGNCVLGGTGGPSGGNTIGGGISNCAGGAGNGYSTVAGGQSNTASGYGAVVAGGSQNTSSSVRSVIAGGRSNTASAIYATVAGGGTNTASGNRSTVSGGTLNIASTESSNIAGGRCNTVSGVYSNVGGGNGNYNPLRDSNINGGVANHTGGCLPFNITAAASISGSGSQTRLTGTGIQTYFSSPFTSNNVFVYYATPTTPLSAGALTTATIAATGTNYIIINGDYSTCTPTGLSATSIYVHDKSINNVGWANTIGGGKLNTASGCYSTIGGGGCNRTSCYYATIAGGAQNNACSFYAVIAGGYSNTVSGYFGVVAGGFQNNAGARSFIGGGRLNSASGYHGTVSGGYRNCITNVGQSGILHNSTISGGYRNCVLSNMGFVGGGQCNVVSCSFSSIVGGCCNVASGFVSFVAGGSANDTKGFANTFILGTGLSATAANYTYVNNISSQGAASVGGILTSNYSGAADSSVLLLGGNTKGGAGYNDFLRVYNPTGANSIWFRTNNVGSLELINSAYTQSLLGVNQTGNLLVYGGGAAGANTSNDGLSGTLQFNNNNSQIYDDGNFHIHSRGSGQSMWFNTNGGDIRVGQQATVSGGTAANSILFGGASNSSPTAYVNVLGYKTYAISSYGYLNGGGAGTVGGSSGSVNFGLYVANRTQSAEVDVTSDERVKDIQGTIPLEDAIKFVKNVDGIKYTWKEGFGDEGLKTGFGAQSVHKAGFEHMISHITNDKIEGKVDKDGWVHPDKTQLSMGYNQVIPYHHEVIKSLLNRVDELEATIKVLKEG